MGNAIKVAFYGTFTLAAVVLIMSFYPQFLQGYEMKRVMKLACNDFILLDKHGTAPADPNDKFIAQAKPFGVTFKKPNEIRSGEVVKTQYSFEVKASANKKMRTCVAKVLYPVEIKWFLLKTLYPAMQNYVFDKKIKITHEIMD